MDDYEILKPRFLYDQIVSKGDGARGRARPPLPRHALHPNDPHLGLEPL
jgi:hypothetical protein